MVVVLWQMLMPVVDGKTTRSITSFFKILISFIVIENNEKLLF